MDFHGGMLAKPHHSEICMGEERKLNETCSSGDSRYLYENLSQVTWPHSEVLLYCGCPLD